MEDLLSSESLVDAHTHPTAAQEDVGQLSAFGQADEPDAWTPFSLDGTADALLRSLEPVPSRLGSQNDPMLFVPDVLEQITCPLLDASEQDEVELPLDSVLSAAPRMVDRVPSAGDERRAYDAAFEQQYSAARPLLLQGVPSPNAEWEERLRFAFKLGWDGGYERGRDEAFVAPHDFTANSSLGEAGSRTKRKRTVEPEQPDAGAEPIGRGGARSDKFEPLIYYWEQVRLVHNPNADVKKWFEDRYDLSKTQIQDWCDNRRRKERGVLKGRPNSLKAAAIRAKKATLGRDQAAEVVNLDHALQAGVKELTSGLRAAVFETPGGE